MFIISIWLLSDDTKLSSKKQKGYLIFLETKRHYTNNPSVYPFSDDSRIFSQRPFLKPETGGQLDFDIRFLCVPFVLLFTGITLISLLTGSLS